MFSTPSPLEYARPTHPRRRLFHLFLLPLLWLPAGIGSRIHSGDEFIPFFVAHLPAAPLAWLLESRVEIETLFRIAIAFNFTLMIALGLLMDRLRVPRLACLLLPPLLLAAVLSRFFVFDTIPPRQTPWPAHVEWEPVFLFPAWAWSTYLFALGAITLTLLIRLVARLLPRRG